MKLITGATGTNHVTSNNDGEFNQGIWGDGAVILQNGNQLEVTIESNNRLDVADGDLVWQGRHALIEPNTSEKINIDNGENGKKRIDLVCARYTLDQGLESIELVVKKGTASTGTPVAPSYQEGNIRTGSAVAEIPLFQVNITNLTITSVTRLVRTVPYIVDIVNRKMDYGENLPPADGYVDGDIFLLYK